jgi:uncharacterized protein YqhQ
MPKQHLGGQAVLEGLMMRSPEIMAIAVRRRDGSVALLKDPMKKTASGWTIHRIPILRGLPALLQCILLGFKALDYSSKIILCDTQNQPPERFNDRSRFTDMSPGSLLLALASILAALALFFILPHGLLKTFKHVCFFNNPTFLFVEALLSLFLVALYTFAISFIPEIRRAFQYHGAEHKVIHAYEKNLSLTLDNVRPCSRFHHRCGTVFLSYVFLTGIIAFSFISPNVSLWITVLIRILLLPLIAGLSFEMIAYLDKTENRLAKTLALPGILFQQLTTREPNDDQLEVGITALNAALEDSAFR